MTVSSGQCQLYNKDKRQNPGSFLEGGDATYYEWLCQNSECLFDFSYSTFFYGLVDVF
jgi:hypothetical protein